MIVKYSSCYHGLHQSKVGQKQGYFILEYKILFAYKQNTDVLTKTAQSSEDNHAQSSH
jgi:hypothetical protein